AAPTGHGQRPLPRAYRSSPRVVESPATATGSPDPEMAKKKRAARTERQVARIRNGIIAFVVALVVLIIGYGLVYTTGITEGEYREGTHYPVLEDARGRRPGEPILVREFFSYGCVHCRNFDPMLEDWKGRLPEDVEFERTPVAFSPVWALL